MYVNNPEVKKFITKYFIIFLLAVGLTYGVSILSINIIKEKVVENNQAIIGRIVSNNPQLESQIIDIITQGNSSEDLELGKEILSKYNYNNISLFNEPIISKSINNVYLLNFIFIVLIFLLILITILSYFKKLYKDIKDMTEYVYNSSEGRAFDMKNNFIFIVLIFLLILITILSYFKKLYKDIKDMTEYVYNSSEGRAFDMKNINQEGQIGLLKTELLKMTNILKEKAELLQKEKIFLNDTMSDISHQLRTNQEGQIGLLKTELLKMTNILKEKAELLQKEKIFLNDTMSDISHQLRTPMTSLMILNDLMYDDLPNEVKIDFLDKIKHQLNRMDWLIKSMLKLSKVDAKVIDFKKEKINIKELIHKATAPIIIPMEIKNQNLIIEGDDTSSYIGDMSWSVEALVNIIKNCVEHTKENGQIHISYEENPIYSKIIIKDSGEGIDKKDIAHIFKRFYRGKSSSKTESVGIGLAMAKSIINSQNGDISVSSEKDKGTTFNITFHKNYSD